SRRQGVTRRPQVPVLCCDLVQRNERMMAASFLRVRIAPLVCEEILQSREQERPELASVSVYRTKAAFLQNLLEKRLGQVLCIMGRITASTHKTVEWAPIGFAEGLQCGVGLRFAGLTGR